MPLSEYKTPNSKIIEHVSVALDERSYDILIGDNLLSDLGHLIKPVITGKRVVIITDDNVAKYHLAAAENALKDAGIESDAIILPHGEATKSFTAYEKLLNDLLALKIERRDTLIALGGGVVGDLTGFAAATLRRGMDFIQVPTTLLSQVDSSVGGKTGINSKFGKNLIGAFHQPKAVIIDLDLLDTLPKRELLAGYAEVVKYGCINSIQFFEWLENQGEALLNGNRKRQAHAVATSCRSKAAIVSKDEFEGGIRALLNLGHTFGHALEAELGYDGRLLHGEAIAIGMVLAFETSARLGMCNKSEATRIAAHFKAIGLPAHIRDIDADYTIEALMQHMAQDKKIVGGELVFILAKGIGKSEICDKVPLELVKSVLKDDL